MNYHIAFGTNRLMVFTISIRDENGCHGFLSQEMVFTPFFENAKVFRLTQTPLHLVLRMAKAIEGIPQINYRESIP